MLFYIIQPFAILLTFMTSKVKVHAGIKVKVTTVLTEIVHQQRIHLYKIFSVHDNVICFNSALPV